MQMGGGGQQINPQNFISVLDCVRSLTGRVLGELCCHRGLYLRWRNCFWGIL